MADSDLPNPANFTPSSHRCVTSVSTSIADFVSSCCHPGITTRFCLFLLIDTAALHLIPIVCARALGDEALGDEALETFESTKRNFDRELFLDEDESHLKVM